MKYQLFSVKDCCSSQFSEIKPFVNQGTAERWFKNLCAESKIAQDLQLYYLGEYDIQTGEIKPCCTFICGGVS